MPQDPDLYGQRAAKRQKKETSIPSSLSFSASLSSLITRPNISSTSTSTFAQALASTSTGRARPSKQKSDIFSNVKVKRKAADNNNTPPSLDASVTTATKNGKLQLRDVRETEDEKAEAERGRRKMEEKARLYAAMKRGDYITREGDAAPLVDFDRKWAERQQDAQHDPSSSGDSSDDDKHDDNAGEFADDKDGAQTISYEDEYGRLRTTTLAEKRKLDRQIATAQQTATELSKMSARPVVEPTKLIFGDTIQSDAFVTSDQLAMEDLARRRDRSATPPEMKHYDANAEIRTKGVGFFQFSRDEATRKKEMEELERQRAETEREREAKDGKEREEKERKADERRRVIEERRREIETRKKEVTEMRAKKLADNFLEGLADEMGDDGREKSDMA